MKKTSRIPVIAVSENENALFKSIRIYLAVAFIYIYFIAAIFL